MTKLLQVGSQFIIKPRHPVDVDGQDDPTSSFGTLPFMKSSREDGIRSPIVEDK